MVIPKVFTKYKIIVVVAILVALASIPSVYYFRQYQKSQFRLNNPAEAAKQDARDAIEAVGRLMILPEGEEPTVMQVADVSKLQDQPFFINAQNGDKVLIYTKAKKAILYRTQINKIIDVASINIESMQAQSTTSGQLPTVSPTPSRSGPTPTATPKPATDSATPSIENL